MRSGIKKPRIFVPGRWLLVALIVGVWILLLRSGWLSPAPDTSLYVMNSVSSGGCKAVGPHVGTRFELLEVYWLGGSQASGACVLEVHLSGYKHAKLLSVTGLAQYLRDEVGISEEELKTAFILY